MNAKLRDAHNGQVMAGNRHTSEDTPDDGIERARPSCVYIQTSCALSA